MAKLTEADREMYRLFSLKFPKCWICGTPGFGMNPLERAHILRGCSRVHDRRAILMLCKKHHSIFDGATIRDGDGVVMPKITRANALWLKLRFDPEFYDVEFLNSISIRRMPAPEPLDEYYG